MKRLLIFIVGLWLVLFGSLMAAAQPPERGLLVIMRAGCPVCVFYTPRLKHLAALGLTVTVVAMDSLPLADWPNALPDRGQSRRLNITGVPTTFLFEGGRIKPLGMGLIPEATLRRHLRATGDEPTRTGRIGL